MRKHGGTPSRRDKHVTLAAISPPGVARGRFVGGQQSGLAGCKPPPLFTRGASSCSSQGRRQGEPWGASPRPSAPTYLPTSIHILFLLYLLLWFWDFTIKNLHDFIKIYRALIKDIFPVAEANPENLSNRL